MALQLRIYFLSEDDRILKESPFLGGYITLEDLQECVQYLFDELRGNHFKIYWKNEDNMDIIISNDTELDVALNELKVRELYVKCIPKSNHRETGMLKTMYENIECTECSSQITCFLYKCLVCLNHNICENCERNHCHSHHPILRISPSLSQIITEDFLKEISLQSCISMTPHFASAPLEEGLMQCLEKADDLDSELNYDEAVKKYMGKIGRRNITSWSDCSDRYFSINKIKSNTLSRMFNSKSLLSDKLKCLAQTIAVFVDPSGLCNGNNQFLPKQ